MPAPFTIVTFADTDGDLFPVRVDGHFDPGFGPDYVRVVDLAAFELCRLVDAGELRPTYPVTVTDIERR